MKRLILISVFFFISLISWSQSTISGYISEGVNKDTKITLVQLSESDNGKQNAKVVASAPIDKNGYFHLNTELTQLPRFYYVSSHGLKKEHRSGKFLLSNDDTIFFQKSDPSLSSYKTTSRSDMEWQKMVAFKGKIKKKKFLDEIRTYSKDSLQILAVKLLSIRELDKKQLLEKDILTNRTYYTAILKELKESEIDPKEYLFLELKLVQLQILQVEENYAMSKRLNILLICIVLGIVLLLYRNKNAGSELSALSKQEVVIKDLILEEKSNKEIASELFISVSTVKSHITNIYQKLHVSNRNDLIQRFKNSTGTSP